MIRNRLGSRTARLHLEHLEDRSVPSTFTVNTTLDDVTPANGKLSLREAITKANNHPGADVIVLPAGVFKITQAGAGEDANATGDFDITDTVTIQGAGAGLTIIDGQQLDRVFDVHGSAPSSIRVVLQGLTVRNGNVTGDGGGIRFGNADLVTRDCIVSGNRASANGGGIANTALPGTGNVKVVRTTVARNVAGAGSGGLDVHGSSVLTAIDSTIRRNLASGSGGGIIAITATLTNCTVSGNSASIGGGISATTVTLTNCTVSGNSASFAGGITAATVTLTNCTISGNSAVNNGGGVIAGTSAKLTNCTVSGNSAANGDGGGIIAVTATLTNCTVNGNSASKGGGGISSNGTVAMTNSTVSGNTASERGGGINAATATLTNSTITGNTAVIEGGGVFATAASLLNCTVVENIAGTGGGLFHVAGGTFNVRNTIVALNLVGFGGNGPDAFGASFISQGHNLVGNGTGSNGFTNGDIVGTAANPIDPKLGALANNGGKTKTHALLAGSLAIDRGDNSILPPTDQRGAGFARKKDGNGDGLAIVDIGAFEK